MRDWDATIERRGNLLVVAMNNVVKTRGAFRDFSKHLKRFSMFESSICRAARLLGDGGFS